jgi:dolichol-phosphate mannosyltransferase
MKLFHTPRISIVIPCFNENDNITPFFDALDTMAESLSRYNFEFVYVDDGSIDSTLTTLQEIAKRDKRVKVIRFSRNFGKEMATTAGIRQATGDAIILMDADGQHPVTSIPAFLAHWKSGTQVVIGVRSNAHKGFLKNISSKIFYRLFNTHADQELLPGSTDFRLIDRVVQQEFIKLTEHSRITRGLIDWLGFRREVPAMPAIASIS